MHDKLIIRDIWIGGFTKDQLIEELKREGINVNEYASMIMNHQGFETLQKREKVRTCEISVGDLGFEEGAVAAEIYIRATEYGLRLCPVELGPNMRLQYLDQPIQPPKGNWLTIAMQELSEDPEFPKGFYLRRLEDGYWLRGYKASTDYLWKPEDRFIFI